MKPILVFQTDFTYKEGAVSAMYGVVKSVDRTLDIVDGTHEIPQFDIWSASYRLYQTIRFWPTDTIFVSVVDPGVGTKRKPCVAKLTDGYMVVTPDNGSLTHLSKHFEIEWVREIDVSNRLVGKNNEEVAIFDGRDLFGYTGARLASGQLKIEDIGPLYPVEEIVKLPLHDPQIDKDTITGILEIDDPNFGNLWTNIDTKLFKVIKIEPGDTLMTTISNKDKVVYEKPLKFVKSFGDVKKGDDLIYHNELNKVALATSQGSFTQKNDLRHGEDWKIVFKKVSA